jgi:TatD DNase family protein
LRLVDSHAHIGAPELLPEADDLVSRAREAGVEAIIAVGSGYGVENNAGAIALAQEQRGIWATAGVHPHDAAEWDETAAQSVDAWSRHERVVAIGECGLDYWYEHSPRDAQRECLRGQIRLARRTDLPLVIHIRPSRGTRDAFGELLEIFDEEGADRVGGVIHCFTGDLEFGRECLARGFEISFSGILTFKGAQELRDVATALPLDRLLIETDCPLLAPVPHRGSRNEPAFVVKVAECLAELHGRRPEEIGERTAERTYRTFRIQAEG